MRCVSYAEVIAGCEGSRSVRAWSELAELLDGRGGWRFVVEDGMCSWRVCGRRRVWATAAGRRHGGMQFTVWQGGRTVDDATWWDCSTVAGVAAVLDELDAGRRPAGGRFVGVSSPPAAISA